MLSLSISTSTTKNLFVAAYFDGTTRVCECLAVLLRFALRGFLQQRVIALRFLKYSTNANDLSRVVVNSISTRLRVPNNRVVAFGHDRAAVNGCAYRQISFLYPIAEDLGCWSHTIDNAGDAMKIPAVKAFLTPWRLLIGQSQRSRMIFKSLVGKYPVSTSETRWWSSFEQIHQVFLQWRSVQETLRICAEEGVAPANTAGCQTAAANPKILVEMSAVVDAALLFCQSGYFLEGDGFLVSKAYEVYSELCNHISTCHFPLLTQESKGDQDLIQHGKLCVKPMFDYFTSRFAMADLKSMVGYFKAGRVFHPGKVQRLHDADASFVSASLNRFLFLSEQERSNLLSELPRYLAAAEDYPESRKEDHELFWRRQLDDLRCWSEAAFRAALVQPSSACAERVFSMVKAANSDIQENALEDQVEGAVMKRYNNVQRARMTHGVDLQP